MMVVRLNCLAKISSEYQTGTRHITSLAGYFSVRLLDAFWRRYSEQGKANSNGVHAHS
jgi:hypothetical protein